MRARGSSRRRARRAPESNDRGDLRRRGHHGHGGADIVAEGETGQHARRRRAGRRVLGEPLIFVDQPAARRAGGRGRAALHACRRHGALWFYRLAGAP